MSHERGYGQFCPVAMAAEALCTRWTVLILRELLAGSTRFNELRKGLPRMSPALLSKRLRELEDIGVIVRRLDDSGANPEYHVTEAGRDLQPVVMSMGVWGQRWLESQLSLKNLDPSLLMWDMRRNLDPAPLPPRRVTIQFLYPDARAGQQEWWLIVDGDGVDLCSVEPGYEVDLHVTCDVRTMTAIWMGISSVRQAVADHRLDLDGDRTVSRHMQEWLGLSPFAKERKRVDP